MAISFTSYLKKPSKSNQNASYPVYLNIAWGKGVRWRIDTNQNCKLSTFERLGLPRDTRSNVKVIIDQIEKLYFDFVHRHNREPSKEELKRMFTSSGASESRLEVIQFIEQETNREIRLNKSRTNPITSATLSRYSLLHKELAEFTDRVWKRTLLFTDMTSEFEATYKDWLRTEKNLSANTIGDRIKVLKKFLNKASNIKDQSGNTLYYVNPEYKSFEKNREEVDNVYLSITELEELWNLDLSHHWKLERVRDLFLIGCWTGLRFEDFTTLRTEDIKLQDRRINVVHSKTSKTDKKDRVTIPILPHLEVVLRKYSDENGKVLLPERISNQKMNDYVKQVCAMLPSMQTKVIYKGQEVPKYEAVASHTARRSFATNMVKLEVPVSIIMKITGHKKEETFYKYIKLAPQEHATIMEDIALRNLNKLGGFMKAV